MAGVIARRGYPMLSQRGAPAFLAWVGAPGEIQGSRQVARIMESLHVMRTLRAMAPHSGDPRPHVVPQRPDLQVLRHRDPKLKRERTRNWPNCGPVHDRNLRAAINLRNLIMPAGRSQDGPGQEAMGQQGCRLRAQVIAVLFRHKKSRPCRGERERDPGAGIQGRRPGMDH